MKRQCAHDKICFIWTQGTFALQCQSPKKNFSALQASIWSKNRGAPSPPLPWIRPSPGSATNTESILEFEKSPTVIQNSFSYPFCIFVRKKKVSRKAQYLLRAPIFFLRELGFCFLLHESF